MVQERLDYAKKLGASSTLLVKRGVKEEDLVKEVKILMGGNPKKSIDCSGAEQTARLAVLVSLFFTCLVSRTLLHLFIISKATKSGGTVVLVGMGAPEIKLPLVNALVREVDIRGVFRYANE